MAKMMVFLPRKDMLEQIVALLSLATIGVLKARMVGSPAMKTHPPNPCTTPFETAPRTPCALRSSPGSAARDTRSAPRPRGVPSSYRCHGVATCSPSAPLEKQQNAGDVSMKPVDFTDLCSET